MIKKIIVEGIKDILEILEFNENVDYKIKEIVFFKKKLEKYKDIFLEIKKICDYKKIPMREIFRKEFIEYKKTIHSNGIFLILEIKDYNDDEIEKILSLGEKILILYNIQDPGNFGTIIRTAGLMGVDCIITIGNSISISNNKVIRSIKGYFFGIKIIESKDDNFIFDILKKLNYKIFVADIGEDSINIKDIFFDKGKKAFIFGSEGLGFKDFDFKNIFNKNMQKIKIELKNNILKGSLNLAVSCGIVLFEVNNYGRDAKINKIKK